MNKNLEAFRDILGILSAVSGCEVDMDSERVRIVESAINRLEAIDNSNPSEALKCLEKIIDNLDDYADFEIKQEANEYIATIKQSLINTEKEHNALEIIKKTKNIKVSFYENGSGKHYKIEFDKTRNQTITEEEFNTLKEVLE